MQTTHTHINGIDTDQLKQTIEDIKRDHRVGIAKFQVATRWMGDGPASETRITSWSLGGKEMPRNFTIAIDEPQELLGRNSAPNPQEVLMAAMNACILATYAALCSLNDIELESLSIETEGELDLRGFLGLDKSVKPGYDELHYNVFIKGNGTREQFEAIHRQAMATSPNYWNMANPITLKPRLIVE